MNTQLQTRIVRYLEAREAVKSVFPMESEYSFPVGANLYVTANTPVDIERLRDCKRFIKSEAGIFSNFRGSVFVPLACKLALCGDPAAQWERARANYRMLDEHFFRSEYLALAALLLTDSASDADVAAIAARARTLYLRMRGAHPFLTGQEDAVFSVLLAQSPRSDDELFADMEECYRLLDARFPKSDGMQAASHVLAMIDGASAQKAGRMIALFDAIADAGGRYGREWQLPALAAFAADDTPVESIASDMLEAAAFLHGQSGYRTVFGYDRKTRMMHAAMLVASERDAHLANTAAQQSAIAMIAAQQAMLCAMVACSAASASAASSAH